MTGEKVRDARKACGLSQQELAGKAGVSRQTIIAIEKGNYNPTINLCITICRILGKTLDELFWE
jgi:putative transcriptional regulator